MVKTMNNKYAYSLEDVIASYHFSFIDRYQSCVPAAEDLAAQLLDCNSLDEVYYLADSNLELWKDIRYVSTYNFRRYEDHIRYIDEKFCLCIGRIIRNSNYQDDPLLQDKLTELFGSAIVYEFLYDLKIRKME